MVVLLYNFFILAIKKRTRPFLSYLLLYFLAAQELWKRKRCCLHEQQHMCDLNSLALLFLTAKILLREKMSFLFLKARKAYSVTSLIPVVNCMKQKILDHYYIVLKALK